MSTNPTRPTPPLALALPPPDALAPVSVPTEALVLPGAWQIEGLPATVRRAGPQAAERTTDSRQGPRSRTTSGQWTLSDTAVRD